MEIELKVDQNYPETKVVVYTPQMTEEVNRIVAKLSETATTVIAGYLDDTVCLLEGNDIIRAYAQNGKVFAVTKDNTYTVKMRLYELENRLDYTSLVRISNGEIINLKMVNQFDLSITGTICVELKNGDTTFVSRRYVSKIKNKLGI